MTLKAEYICENLWWKGLGFPTPNKTLDHIPLWTLWPNHNMSPSQLHQFDVAQMIQQQEP